MRCPKCGAKTRVIDSRETPDGTKVYRRRACPCGWRENTEEQVNRYFTKSQANRLSSSDAKPSL